MDKRWNRRASSPWALTILVLMSVAALQAQQKGQYVPGQFGLNAGVVPDSGLTYANVALNYSASSLNDANGNHRPNVVGTYGFWADENIFYFVPKKKILGASFAPYISLNVANGSLVADISGTNLGATGGGSGFADLFVQPVNLGWHLKRADIVAGYAFFAPTGRFSAGARNNVGSGYWGNDLTFGTTVYVTKNKGTSLNLFTDWETHGQKTGTALTPGKTFTIEWGAGQLLPLKKDFSRLLQLGLIGYDQWQISANSGTIGNLPASSVPFYSVHAVGLQSNYILPTKNLNFFFKYLNEYKAISRPEGRTIVFGGSWTLRIPKPPAPKP
ncbi:SphA family protein [Tunturiibacter gelidiferens]|uniref:SphA family protein n=1 Tax=Tunturiibacter gelidiferens TaxID=3069689 RepID=UPI003D9BBFA6